MSSPPDPLQGAEASPAVRWIARFSAPGAAEAFVSKVQGTVAGVRLERAARAVVIHVEELLPGVASMLVSAASAVGGVVDFGVTERADGTLDGERSIVEDESSGDDAS